MKLMLYLAIDKHHLRLLLLRKTLLGQYESAFYEKKHQVNLIENGKAVNTDLLASAIKESLTFIAGAPVKEKDITLILPQKSFYFLRSEVPNDIAPTALQPFLKDKARAELGIDIDNVLYDYTFHEGEKEKLITLFAIGRDVMAKYYDACKLINLQIAAVIPESLAYFKLFEKTLRKDKKEHILFVSFDQQYLSGYVYDSTGPLEKDKTFDEKLKEDSNIEKLLKQKANEYEKDGKKMNRLILSGIASENVRQDTFTKNVGVWTNPLKRIIPDFYQDYLKLLVASSNKPLPFLQYDSCIGAFIFSIENKNFSFFKRKVSVSSAPSSPSFTPPSIKLPFKEIGIFVASFILSFIVLYALSRIDTKSFSLPQLPMLAQATPTPTVTPQPPTATPTPAPSIERAEIKIKVLNGSGIKGKANDVKAVLQQAGYEEVLTGNADNFDYEQTEIEAKDPNVAAVLKEDLKENVPNPKISTLDEKNTADVIITFGKDFK